MYVKQFEIKNISINGSVNSKRGHPFPPPGHLSGICHLVGPHGGDLAENLCPGIRHLSVLLEEVNAVPFFTISLKNMNTVVC